MAENNHIDFVVELLRRIQADLTQMKASLHDLQEGQISIRNQLHAMQGDTLRQERTIAALQLDMDRVKTRLELHDA